MAPYLFFFFVSITGLAYGTYTDWKERIVSNKVTYGMIALGLAAHIVWAAFASNAMIALYSIAATAATFVLAYGLYRIGMWAGGDVKLFTGLAALNPLNPNLLTSLGIINVAAFQAIEIPIFPLTLFMFSLFAMLPYGACLAAARLLRNPTEKKKFKQDMKKRLLHAIELSAAIVGLGALLSALGMTQWLVLPLLLLIALTPKKAKYVLAAVLLFIALWLNAQQSVQQFAALLSLFLGFYLLFKLYSLSKVLMRKPVKIADLEEGMISGQTIVQTEKKVEIVPELGIKKLIKYFASYRFGKAMQMMQPQGKVIVSGSNAAGLTEADIGQLKKLAKGKKIPGNLIVKESAPFVPAVLIAYIALNIVGDVIWFWLL